MRVVVALVLGTFVSASARRVQSTAQQAHSSPLADGQDLHKVFGALPRSEAGHFFIEVAELEQQASTVQQAGRKVVANSADAMAELLLALAPAGRFQSADRARSPRMAVATQSPTAVSTIRGDLAAAIGNEPNAEEGMADEDALLDKSTFPIPPDQLIGLAKAFTYAQINGSCDGSNGASDWFADDFRFVAPVVGPLDKELFVDSLKSFDLRTAFPTLSSNYHHWRVCPFEPNRVWYSVKYIGKNEGPVLGQPATNKYVESPVQTHSVTFNEKGEVTKFTIGYVMDKETGNTGGLGGVFGLFYAIGYALPFPEAQPWSPSPFYGTLMNANRLIQDAQKANPAFKSAVQSFVTTFGKRDS
jgi:hypothetical protein